MTIYLRFPDEATAKNAMAMFYGDDAWNVASLAHTLDPLGTLYGDDGYPLDGWHLNFIGDLPEAAQSYVLTPTNPRVVFAS